MIIYRLMVDICQWDFNAATPAPRRSLTWGNQTAYLGMG
jgi:hypothetical protein